MRNLVRIEDERYERRSQFQRWPGYAASSGYVPAEPSEDSPVDALFRWARVRDGFRLVGEAQEDTK